MEHLNRRILLIGPLPPPDHGTSVPFKLLVATIKQCARTEVYVINTQSGDKTGVPLYAPRAFMPFINMLPKLIYGIAWCDIGILYGSQRFISTVGALVSLIFRFCKKSIHVRIAGGGFDNYYFSLVPWRRLALRNCLRCASTVLVETQMLARRMADEFPEI